MCRMGMTRILKTSGFLGLTVMMIVGLYQNMLVAGGQTPPPWMVGGHAHLGVLSILAIVLGFAVPALDVTGRVRTAVTALFVAGQWGLPVTIWIGEGGGLTALMPLTFLWGVCLIVAMAIMAYVAATAPSTGHGREPAGAAVADD